MSQRRKPHGGGESHAGRQNANRNTKYGRGGPPPQRDGKRQYDRRSGTGRGREIRKDGGGAHNWGSDANEARSIEGVVADDGNEITESAQADTQEPDNEAGEETPGETYDNANEPEPEPEPKPEDNTVAYEDYIAMKKEQEQSENLKPVKVREVQNEFAHVKEKSAVEEDFLVMGGGKEKRVKKQKEKSALELDVGFRSGGEGGSNFRGGGRGRGRGRGGRFDDERNGGRRSWRGGRDDRDGGGRGGRGDRDGDYYGGGRGGRGDRDDRYGGGYGFSGDGNEQDRGRHEFRGDRDGGDGEGRGRGGRGRGRGRGFRGEGRGRGRGRGSGGLNVNDEHDFPSLG